MHALLDILAGVILRLNLRAQECIYIHIYIRMYTYTHTHIYIYYILQSTYISTYIKSYWRGHSVLLFSWFFGVVPVYKNQNISWLCSKIALLFAVLFEPFFFAGISRKNGPLSVQKDYCVLS